MLELASHPLRLVHLALHPKELALHAVDHGQLVLDYFGLGLSLLLVVDPLLLCSSTLSIRLQQMD